jgi:hypothetical protein
MKSPATRKLAPPLLFILITIYLGYRLVNAWIEKNTFDCSKPPDGVIRFTLFSGRNDARLYEWRGTVFRQVGTTPIGQQLVAPYPEGSYHNPYYWGAEVQGIDRRTGDAGSILSTPYAVSPDRQKLVAAVGQEFNYSEMMEFLRIDNSKIIASINLQKYINAIAWDPQSHFVVVLFHSERYGLNPLSLFGALFGHPIPYSNISLKIIEPTGATVCTIHPAHGLPYGGGYVRWDAN